MPRVRAKYEALVELYEKVSPSVVALSRVRTRAEEPTNRLSRAGTGFVVHCNAEFTVVAVHRSFTFDKHEVPLVKFCNDTEVQAVWIPLTGVAGPMNLVVATVPLGNWKEVDCGDIREKSKKQSTVDYSVMEEDCEEVFTVACAFGKRLKFLTHIISPTTTCVGENNVELAGTRDTFTYHLPISGKYFANHNDDSLQMVEYQRNQVLGSPIFNTAGQNVGFLDQCGLLFDLKFGMRSKTLAACLDKWLGGKTWKDAVNSAIKRSEKTSGSRKRSHEI